MLKKVLLRSAQVMAPLCFNALNFLLAGNLPPLGCAIVVVEDQGRFLVVKISHDRAVLPGGFMRWREYPEETARRETREETGLDVRLLDTIGIYSVKSRGFGRLSTLTVAFTGEVIAGSLKGSIEGYPCWMEEAEMRRRLTRRYRAILEDYDAYRKRRAQG